MLLTCDSPMKKSVAVRLAPCMLEREVRCGYVSLTHKLMNVNRGHSSRVIYVLDVIHCRVNTINKVCVMPQPWSILSQGIRPVQHLNEALLYLQQRLSIDPRNDQLSGSNSSIPSSIAFPTPAAALPTSPPSLLAASTPRSIAVRNIL